MPDYKQMFRLDYVIFKAAPSFGVSAATIARMALDYNGNWATAGGDTVALLAVPPDAANALAEALDDDANVFDFETL